MSECGMPEPIYTSNSSIPPDIISRELTYDAETLLQKVASTDPLLVKDQKIVYEVIMNSVYNSLSEICFIDAPGGTGKTFICNLLLAKVRSTGSVALAISSSGIASTLLDGGRTAHSVFKIPVDITHIDHPVCSISKSSKLGQFPRITKLIIWNEAPMSHRKCFEALDITLRDVRDCSRPMGGLTFIMSGDFRQTLPVVQNGTRADQMNACVESSYL